MSEGMVVSFYSYKGGVGRTFALANIGALLTMWEYKVLCVDWDLEAPGLVQYFAGRMESEKGSEGGGILELVEGVSKGEKPDWRKCVQKVNLPRAKEHLSVITAGMQNDAYVARLQQIDWEKLYEKHHFGSFVEKIRKEWKKNFDFTLVDCRTGITDINGISTVQLPDALVFSFSANQQSLDGVVSAVKRVVAARNELPFERSGLIALPVVSRMDMREERELAREWIGVIESKVGSFYNNWVHRDVAASKILAYTSIPYVAYWSFGEKLAVIDEVDRGPESISYSFETLAALIARRFSETKELARNRDSYVSAVSKERPSVGEVRAPRKRELRELCSEIIERNDLLGWRRLIGDIGREVTDKIIEWKPKGERAAHQGGEEWEKAVLEVAEICLPGFVPILSAIDKGKKDFWSESASTLKRLAILETRMGGGATWVLNIGARMLYVAGSLGAAMAVDTKQIDFVNEWMVLPMPNPDSDRHEEIPWAEVLSAHRLPQGLKLVYKEPFKLHLKVCESDYVAGFFPNRERFVQWLFLGNLLQSLVELRRCTEKEDTRKTLEEKGKLQLDVWPVWCLMDNKDFTSWTWDLFGSSRGVLSFVFPGGTTVAPDRFWAWWKNWKYVCGDALRQDLMRMGKFFDWRGRWLTLPGEPPDEDA